MLMLTLMLTPRPRHMHQISDGERRRVQLCMGLMGEWDVLLLDEVSGVALAWACCGAARAGGGAWERARVGGGASGRIPEWDGAEGARVGGLCAETSS